MATKRASRRSKPLKTVPMAPAPIVPTTSYLPMDFMRPNLPQVGGD